VAVARPDIDEARTAMMGGSYGGYMANWIAGHSGRFQAIVSHAGLWALDQIFGTTDLPSYWRRIFGDPATQPERYLANSPNRHVGQVSPGEHGDDPGRLERGADVDGGDPRVRDGRTDEVDVARAGQAHVLGIDPAGGQEAGIFGPDYPGAQYAHGHDLAWAGHRRSKRASAPRGREDRVPLLR